MRPSRRRSSTLPLNNLIDRESVHEILIDD